MLHTYRSLLAGEVRLFSVSVINSQEGGEGNVTTDM